MDDMLMLNWCIFALLFYSVLLNKSFYNWSLFVSIMRQYKKTLHWFWQARINENTLFSHVYVQMNILWLLKLLVAPCWTICHSLLMKWLTPRHTQHVVIVFATFSPGIRFLAWSWELCLLKPSHHPPPASSSDTSLLLSCPCLLTHWHLTFICHAHACLSHVIHLCVSALSWDVPAFSWLLHISCQV